MASRTLHFATAGAALALAVLAAWWVQRPAAPATAGNAPQSSARAGGGAAGPAAPGRAASVEVAPVQTRDLADTVQAVGSLRSLRSVVLRPETSGRIVQLGFADGQRVRKGALLVQLDDQLPRAQVAQAQAELSIAQANDKRNRELVAQGFISQRALDESSASVEVARAKLALAQATAARLRIVAPFDGIAGIGQLSVGEYLKDGADIVNIEDMDTMLVDFQLPERYQSQVHVGQSVQLALDALPGETFAAQVRALDPQIDANGRSLAVRASLGNPKLRLRPGMFARVTLELARRNGALVVPEAAIVPQGTGALVYKVTPGAGGDSTAQRVPVQLGLRGDGVVEITQGVAAGDVVVTAGQQRLQKDETPVRIAREGTDPAQQNTGAAAAPASR